MPLIITDNSISGERTGHSARPVPGHEQTWEVSWLPGRLLSRDIAITAMLIADVVGSRAAQAGDRLWPHIEGWAAEIGVTAPDALAMVTESTGHTSDEHDWVSRAEPEAGA